MRIAIEALFLISLFLNFIGGIIIFVFKIPFMLIAKLFSVIKISMINLNKTKKRKKIRKISSSGNLWINPKKSKKNKFLLRTKIKYFIFGTLFSLVFVFIPLIIIIFLQELPNPKQLNFQEAPLTTKIFDRNGTLLYQIYANQNRTLVPLSSIPKHLLHATIAIEDKSFYRNSGVDFSAIIRAAIADLSGKPLQGGSTITQQLIKTTLLTPEVTISRKIKEIVLAFWAQQIYTKDQILEMYFNQIPYGGTAWGIEAASEIYFGKKTKDLNLPQSAFLAGITRAPTIYSPYGEFPDLWKKRQTEVLNRMEELKYISSKEKNEALKEEIVFASPHISIYAPHFVMYVKDLLVKKYGLGMVEKGGLQITTTLDLKTQDMVQKIVTSEVEKNSYLNLTNGASVVTDPKNGDILAMVGSKDYSSLNSGNFNVATALRQPGSSIKVVTYAAALSNGFTPATIIEDSPVAFRSLGSPTYSPVNYDGRFHGKMSLRIALANSINIPAVKILSRVGVPAMIDLAQKMGITTWNDPNNYGLAITLGAADVKMVDMATLYGVLANGGKRIDLNPILKLTDSQGNILEEKNEESIVKTQALDPGVAFLI
ncbi:MAG: transglycosylase domain-containing protein, partial [Candidatus Levybacteria bacterium]|nr:transglycosylase domain-containing protein [Candidatus Levybacteria bacterium]